MSEVTRVSRRGRSAVGRGNRSDLPSGEFSIDPTPGRVALPGPHPDSAPLRLLESGAVVFDLAVLEASAHAATDRSLPETISPFHRLRDLHLRLDRPAQGRRRHARQRRAPVRRHASAWFGFGRDDVWTLFHSFAFDFSVWEIWGALLYGGRLVVVPYSVSRSPEAFLDLLRARAGDGAQPDALGVPPARRAPNDGAAGRSGSSRCAG